VSRSMAARASRSPAGQSVVVWKCPLDGAGGQSTSLDWIDRELVRNERWSPTHPTMLISGPAEQGCTALLLEPIMVRIRREAQQQGDRERATEEAHI